MATYSKGDQLRIEAWEAESIRLTAFPMQVSPVEDVDWWESLMGKPPETEVVHPREGGKRVEGAFETGKLIIQTTPARIDLRVIPPPEQGGTTARFLTIGKFTVMLESFAEIASGWLDLDSCPEIQRIAFGAVLVSPTDSRASGYRKLQAYLPSVNMDPDHATEFLYQINRARDSATGIANLRINRLSKWSVASMSTAGLVIQPTQILHQENLQEYFACRLELDINTIPDRREPLPHKKLPSIFRELMDFGKEIVIAGDIT